jgi:hypothetical protein
MAWCRCGRGPSCVEWLCSFEVYSPSRLRLSEFIVMCFLAWFTISVCMSFSSRRTSIHVPKLTIERLLPCSDDWRSSQQSAMVINRIRIMVCDLLKSNWASVVPRPTVDRTENRHFRSRFRPRRQLDGANYWQIRSSILGKTSIK